VNPLPLIVAELRRNPLGCAAVVALIAIAVALGVALSAQERAFRVASARAADRFDLVVGAAGSATRLVLTTVYLQPAALDLVPAETLLRLQAEAGVAAVAPVAVTDSFRGYPIVGTTARFATDDDKLPVVDGRKFNRVDEAMIGGAVDLQLGAKVRPVHGTPSENLLETHDHDVELTVVGKLGRTGTPWDRAILVPIEAVWEMHAKPLSGQPEGAITAGSSRVGPPWVQGAVHSVPALVIRPRTVGDAYHLRQQYRGRETMALFPAEVLNQLYAVLGNVRDLLRSVMFAFDVLLAAALLLVIVAVLSARRQSIGVLRALGAPPAFVFVAVWLQGALLIAAGVLVGVGLGFVLTRAVSAFASEQLGLAIDPTIGTSELALAAALLVAGSLLAALPSLPTLRVQVARLLRLV
jgi:putative ABC transport system permease protein